MSIPIEPEAGYNKYAFEPMLHQQFNVLKARLLNLAETVSRDNEQSKALKGLIKDFVNKAYYNSVDEIEKYARFFKVIPDTDHSGGSRMRLEADTLTDLLVE